VSGINKKQARKKVGLRKYQHTLSSLSLATTLESTIVGMRGYWTSIADKVLALCDVFIDRERLGKEVGVVTFSGLPADGEVSILDAVTDPVVTHVHRLGALLLHTVVGDAYRTGVISKQRGGGLWVAEVCQSVAVFFCSTCVEEEGGILRFGDRGH
jgi:hypothetical protein